MVRRRWIQRAIKRRGALTRWAETDTAKKIARSLGIPRFTRSGELNQRFLLRLRKSKYWNRLSTTTKRRINLAITLEKMKKG